MIDTDAGTTRTDQYIVIENGKIRDLVPENDYRRLDGPDPLHQPLQYDSSFRTVRQLRPFDRKGDITA